MKFFFKFLCSFVLIVSLVSPAFAILPALALTAAEIAGAAIVSGGLTYLLGQPGSGNLPSYGRADNYGVKRNLLGKVGPAAAVAVAGAMAYYDLRNAVNANPNQYPLLSQAIGSRDISSTTPSGAIADQTLNYPSGTIINNGGLYYQITGVKYLDVHSASTCVGATLPNPYLSGGVLTVASIYATNELASCSGTPANKAYLDAYYVTAVPQPPPVYYTPPDSSLPSILNGSDGNVRPQYQPEIDGAMQGNPSAVSLPSGDVAAAQSAYNAGQAVAAAQNAVNAQQTAYDSNPTADNLARLEELKQQLADSLANQGQQILSDNDRAAEEAEKAAEQEAADNATANLPTNSYDSSLEMPLLKSIPELLTSFFDNSPLLGVVRSFQITTTDQQSVFNFGTFWGQEITVDFGRWSSVLAGCGAVLLILSHAYAVMIVVRG